MSKNHFKTWEEYCEYLDRCIDGAAKSDNEQRADIRKLKDRIQFLEKRLGLGLGLSGQPCGCDPGAGHVCEWHSENSKDGNARPNT